MSINKEFLNSTTIETSNNEVFTLFDSENNTPEDLLDQVVSDSSGIEIDNDSSNFIGADQSTSFFESIEFGNNANLSNPGILLTSGDGAPPLENTESDFQVDNEVEGDEELTEIAQNAFEGAGSTNDASILEFAFEVTDNSTESISFDVLFGSDEFPEFADSSFVDISAITVNGKNFAFLDGDPTKPLSIVGATVEDGRFIDNTDNTDNELPIEYDGITPQTRVSIPLDEVPTNENNEDTFEVRIGVADTGDSIYDSGFFVSNFQTSESSSGGTQVIQEADDDGSELTAPAPDTATFFIGGPSNDTMTGSTAPDDYDLTQGGANTVQGNLEQLDGDTIIGFDPDDVIKAQDVEFQQEQLQVTQGSAILDIDANDDGETDSNITLEGDFSNAEFLTEQVEGNTEITVNGAILTLGQQEINFETALSSGDNSPWTRATGEQTPNLVSDELSIENTGNEELTIKDIQTPDQLGVKLENPFEGDEILAPGESQTYTVNFNPVEPNIDLEQQEAEMTIVSGEQGEQQTTVNLSGQSTFQGDVNYDGAVRFSDLVKVSQNFGSSQDNDNFNPNVDVNYDGSISFNDLVKISQQFGSETEIDLA